MLTAKSAPACRRSGTLYSMHTEKSATITGMNARMTWFIESSMYTRLALFSAICRPLKRPTTARPRSMLSDSITSTCLAR